MAAPKDFVQKGAQVSCSGCPGKFSNLNVNVNKHVKNGSGSIGVKDDVNIAVPMFVTCLAVPASPKPCAPDLNDWTFAKSDFRIGGKKALLFPNLTVCKKGPGVVSMTRSRTRNVKSGAEKEKLDPKVPCEWNEGCGLQHEYKVHYPNNGDLHVDENGNRKENASYPGGWIHPNVSGYEPGWTPVTKDLPYEEVTIPQYKCDNHHVIPVKAFTDSLSNLSNNLKLIGWNINEGLGNGILLPKKERDIIWHNLPQHNGSHPDWNAEVTRRLEDIQNFSENFCDDIDDKKGKQNELMLLIINEAIELRNMLINWTPPLLNASVSVTAKANSYAAAGVTPAATGSREYLEIKKLEL